MLLANLTLLLLRLVVGLTFAAHGAQKAFGWWSGPGLEKWQNAVASMRFHPAPFWTLTSIAIELVGGVMLAIGFLTPFAAAALIAQSMVIILKVHLPKGFFSTKGGIEFPLSLTAGLLAVMGIGPGPYALDSAIGYGLPEPALWLLIALGLVAGVAAYGLTLVAAPPEAAAQHR
jgi:putative oxidoreductase